MDFLAEISSLESRYKIIYLNLQLPHQILHSRTLTKIWIPNTGSEKFLEFFQERIGGVLTSYQQIYRESIFTTDYAKMYNV